MHILNFYQGHKLDTSGISDFWLYELSIWLHTLARSLVAVFIPILLLKTGFSLEEVIVFFLIYNVFNVPLNFFAESFVRRFGARLAIAASTVATIVFLSILLHLESHTWPLLIALAFSGALYDTLFWVSHLFLFVKSDSSTKRLGANTGLLHALKKSAALLGPAIGAAILIFVSSDVLFYVTIGAYVLSLIPLLKVDEFPDKPEHKPVPAKKFFKTKGSVRTFFSTMLYALHDSVEGALFPLFIFVAFGSIESVAAIPVIVSITSIFVALFLGNVAPKNRTRTIAIGAFLVAIVWILRVVIEEPLFYYLSVSVTGLFAYFILVPLDTAIFDVGKKAKDPLAASMYRNLAYMFTNVFLYGALAVMVNVFEISFLVAAGGLMILAVLNVATFRFFAR